jgi:hydrogenase/urease accessory protein HupE
LANLTRSASIDSKMKCLSPRLFAIFFAFSAAVARAHPGHDGHEGGDFTWDFTHLASHPLATAACALMVGAALWAGVNFLRTRRASRVTGRK